MCNKSKIKDDHKKDKTQNKKHDHLDLSLLTEEQKKFITDLIDDEHCSDQNS